MKFYKIDSANLKTLIYTSIIALLFLSSKSSINYEPGDIVADFKLKNVDGKEISLSGFKDAKGVIIVFDCNTCPYSKAYNERIIALSKNYTPKAFPLIAINANDPVKSPGDTYEAMVAYAKKNHYEFPYLVDETQQVAKTFGATNTPHVFVLSRVGKDFKVVYIGAIDNNVRDASAADKKYVEEVVDALLIGKESPLTKTKAIGCTIKWKDS
jgi:peroxiredoxin